MTPSQITISELTKALDVTLVTVHQWRQGCARRVVIYRDDLQEWLARWRPDLLHRLPENDCDDHGRHLAA